MGPGLSAMEPIQTPPFTALFQSSFGAVSEQNQFDSNSNRNWKEHLKTYVKDMMSARGPILLKRLTANEPRSSLLSWPSPQSPWNSMSVWIINHFSINLFSLTETLSLSLSLFLSFSLSLPSSFHPFKVIHFIGSGGIKSRYQPIYSTSPDSPSIHALANSNKKKTNDKLLHIHSGVFTKVDTIIQRPWVGFVSQCISLRRN